MFFEQSSYPISCPSFAKDRESLLAAFESPIALQKVPSCKTEPQFDTIIELTKKVKQNDQGHNRINESMKAVNEKIRPKELRKRICQLEQRVAELERQNLQLRRSQHQCRSCQRRNPQFYISEGTETEMEDESIDGSVSPRNRSTDSIEFEQAYLHSPLLQAPGMEEKIWIFLGLTMIAMGSKVANWDGALNSFKVLRGAVDDVRRQVQRRQKKVSLDVFCSKQQLKDINFVDGAGYDPFYAEEYPQGLLLEHVRLEAVDAHGLYYDSKYRYSINHEALMTIMEYAKDYCVVS